MPVTPKMLARMIACGTSAIRPHAPNANPYTAYPIHTKMVLIGPEESNSGRVMFGTANMSTAGLRYSEEHVITIDSRRATGQFRADTEDVYGAYLQGRNELSQGNKVCH